MGLAGRLLIYNIMNRPEPTTGRDMLSCSSGGQRLAILYSFAATCKANGICFRKWLEDVLPRLNSTPAGQIDSLIPGAKQSSQ